MSPTRTALALVLLAGCRPDTGLTKFNNEPVATITSHSDGDAVDEGYAFTLVGNVSDANDNAEDLVASWYAGTRELCAEAPVASNGETTCEATLALGESEITLQARDPENALGEDSVTLSVQETGAPAAEILSPAPDGVYYADVPLAIEATVGDEEDVPTDLVLRWTDGSGNEIDLNVTPDDDGLVTDSLSLDAGDYSLVLDVTDSTGKTGSASVDFTVGDANQAPTCTIVSPADGSSGEVGASLSFVAELSDPDVAADTLTASWSSDLDGDLGPTSVGSDGITTLTLDTLSFGTHVMTVTGTDEVGATCTASILYTVGEPPEVEIDAPLSGDLYNEGETVTFLGMATDSGTASDLLDIQWESDLDGVIDVTGADSGGVVTFDTSLLSVGDHVITLTATDAEGLYSTASVDLSINGLPSAPTVSISPTGPGTDDDLVANIDTGSVDPEGDPVGYAYAWYVDGVATAYTTDTVPASATSRDEVWEVFVTPNDGWGDGDWASASVTIGNGAPSLADVTLSPDPAFEGDVLTCSPGAAVDTDGDTISYTYAWTVDGVLVAATTDTLGDTWWDRDEVVVCTVTPSDGSTAGAAVSSNAVTISNSVPSLTDVTISPDPASSSDVLVCSAAGFSDADDDADLTYYEWFVDGVSVGAGETLASGFGGGDTVTCTATPSDGTDDGTALSASVTIDNTPPVLASVTITPANPTEADTLTCVPGATTDADGTTSFTYSYAWTVGGATIAATGSSLDPSDFARGDTIRCIVTPNDGADDGAPVASSTVNILNTAPVASTVTLSPSAPDTDDTLTASATGTDVDGDAVSFTYTWYVNGSTVAATGSTLSGASYFDRDDVVYVVATPTDGSDAGAGLASASITVLDSAPSLTSASITPTTAAVGDTLTCTPNGYADADGDPATYGYAWLVNGTFIGTGGTLSTGFSAGDSVVCTVTPSDGTLAGSPVSSSARTISNSAPVLASVSLTPTTAYESSTLTCTPGTTTDADGTTSFTYTYAWYVNASAISQTGATLSGTYFDAGDAVYCRATPSDGTSAGTAVSSNTVTISNTAPVVSSVTLSSYAPYTNDTLTASVTASDADGDSISYTYTWYVNGSVVGATGSTLSGATYFDRGDTVYVRVTPNDGTTSGTASTSAAAGVQNTAPSLTSVSISPTTAYAGNTLTCTATGFSDADGDADASTYSWTVNGSVAGTSSTLSSGFTAGDAVVCTVTPNDGTTAGTAVSSSTRTIANSAPVIASVSLTPTSAYESSTLTCTPGSTTDADGTTSFTYSYAWYVNSAAISQTSATLSGTYFSAGDTVYCRATASDGLAAGTAVSSNTVTISNTAPVISSVSLTPTTAYEASTLTCAPTGSDADGDTVSYAYTWYVNSAAVAATSSTLTGTYFASGDTVYCRATPNDGTTSGTAVSSSTVTISNTAPVMSSVSVTPTSPSVSSTLTCTPSATDADGDSLTYTYAWYVNSAAVAATSSTLTSAYFSAGSTVYCRATPNDGTTTGTAMSSATVTIGNTAPVISAVSLTPTTAYESSTLTCSPTATDADGDTVSFTYAWYVNSSAVAATGSTLTGTYFSAGNTVYCRATPTDGTTAGTAVSSGTVTISNTLPVVSSVSLTPTTAYEASTLTCAPTATDGDGDTISYAYAWYVNGSAVAATSSTLTGTYFSKGSTVYCRVTPSDSSGSGTAVSSSTVTISNTAPVLSSVSLTPTTASEASTLTCTPTATDADGDSISYTYAWYVNSTAIAATSSTLTGTYFSAGNTVYCQATPNDGSTSGTAMSSSTVTISNTAPVVSSVSLTPTTAYEASTLTCTPTATDADGDTLSYTYKWYVNGSLIAPTTSTLTGTYFSKTNTVYCTVVASDGTTSSSTGTSSTVTISNTAPVVSSVSLSPTLIYESSTVTCTPTASDADGDSISYTYAWYVNSASVGVTTSTITGTYFSKGNTIYCRATPTDGTTSGTAVSSSSYTVGNTAPTAPVASIFPTDPEAGLDAIVCSLGTSSTDVDGDSITYSFTWTKNGVAYTGDTDTSTTSTVPASATAAGNVFVCTITPSDGTTTGTADTESVTVLAASYTIGYASVFASPGTGSTGANYSLCQSQTVSSAATIYSLGNYLRLADGDSMRLAVYTSVGGVPTTFVAGTALTGLSSYAAGSFVELDVTTPTAISAGTYFICENFSGTTYMGYTTSGASANTIYYNSLSSSSAWPTSWGTASTFTGQFLNLYMVVR